MFSRIRYYAGLASLIVFVSYFAISITSNLAQTPAQEVATTVQFYEDAAASWSRILTVFFSMIWIVSTAVHAVLLISKRRPQRIAATAAIAGLGGLFVFTWISVLQRASDSSSVSLTPEWIFWLALLLSLAVQVLDLVLPPWPWGSQKASLVAN
ncbi:MAG: hypothetical protein Q8O19_00450 [Rectinemataceae bacterium]|nr:hypothetical protein [Rectinemataceae bacterium]